MILPSLFKDDESYTCYKCGKIFAYESYLERHVKYVCPDKTGRTWKCSYCSKAFQYPCYLRRHMRSHTGKENKITETKTCMIHSVYTQWSEMSHDSWLLPLPFRRESLQVHAVFASVCPFHWPSKAFTQSHRREAIQMSRVLQSICTLHGPKAAHANAHRRKTLQMLAVLQSFLSVREFANSLTHTL